MVQVLWPPLTRWRGWGLVVVTHKGRSWKIWGFDPTGLRRLVVLWASWRSPPPL